MTTRRWLTYVSACYRWHHPTQFSSGTMNMTARRWLSYVSACYRWHHPTQFSSVTMNMTSRRWLTYVSACYRWHHPTQFSSGTMNGYSHSHSHLHGNRGQRFPPPPLPQPVSYGSYQQRGAGTKSASLYPANCTVPLTQTGVGQQDCNSLSIIGSVVGAGVSFLAKRPSLQDTLPEVSTSHHS
jgi:hypothetical protein